MSKSFCIADGGLLCIGMHDSMYVIETGPNNTLIEERVSLEVSSHLRTEIKLFIPRILKNVIVNKLSWDFTELLIIEKAGKELQPDDIVLDIGSITAVNLDCGEYTVEIQTLGYREKRLLSRNIKSASANLTIDVIGVKETYSHFLARKIGGKK